MEKKNQYHLNASKEDAIALIKSIADLDHENDLARKMTGACGKSGKFIFTLRRLASGGSPTYSPKLIGEIRGDHRKSTIHLRFRVSIIILFFGFLMGTIISVLLYKHYNLIADDGSSLIFAWIAIAILIATILTHFYLKNELKNLFLRLALDEASRRLNGLD